MASSRRRHAMDFVISCYRMLPGGTPMAGWLHRRVTLLRQRTLAAALTVGLVCLGVAAGVLLIAVGVTPLDFLDEYPWVVPFTSVAVASLVIGIGIWLIALSRARGLQL